MKLIVRWFTPEMKDKCMYFKRVQWERHTNQGVNKCVEQMVVGR